MKPTRLIAALVLALAGASAVAAPSQAMTRGHFGFGRGAFGNGYFHSRQVNRQPGSVAVNRNTQGWNGRGVHSTRDASWGNGAYNGSASHTFNNGRSTSRDTSLQRNPDGSVNYDVSRTRLNGSTVDRSGTIDRPLY